MGCILITHKYSIRLIYNAINVYTAISHQACPTLVQCPVNGNHFVPRDSLEKHERQCRYAALGVRMEEVVSQLATDLTWHILN